MTALDPDAIMRAKALLEPAGKRPSMWPVLGAAGLLAASALVFAMAMITAPSLVKDPAAHARNVD